MRATEFQGFCEICDTSLLDMNEKLCVACAKEKAAREREEKRRQNQEDDLWLARFEEERARREKRK